MGIMTWFNEPYENEKKTEPDESLWPYKEMAEIREKLRIAADQEFKRAAQSNECSCNHYPEKYSDLPLIDRVGTKIRAGCLFIPLIFFGGGTLTMMFIACLGGKGA